MTTLTYFFALVLALGQPSSSAVRASGDLTLRVSTENTALRVAEWPVIDVTITNNGTETVNLVHPGDGSDAGWRTPIVAWSVIEVSSSATHPTKPSETPAERMCGNINPLESHEVFALLPGETKKLSTWGALAPFNEPGAYKVVFLYANRPSLEWKGIPLGEHNKVTMWLVRLSTSVTLSSNELLFTVSN
jgi:hypothetical protein